MVLCPGERGPRPRHDAGRWSPAQRASDWEAHGETPARCVRPAPPRVTRTRATPASPSRRHADAHMHAAARPPAEAFDERAVRVGSGPLRRDAPVSQAWGSVVVAELRRTWQRGHALAEAGKRQAARFTRGDRGGAQGAADARGTQVGLTVCGHQRARQRASCASCCGASTGVRLRAWSPASRRVSDRIGAHEGRDSALAVQPASLATRLS